VGRREPSNVEDNKRVVQHTTTTPAHAAQSKMWSAYNLLPIVLNLASARPFLAREEDSLGTLKIFVRCGALHTMRP
jgi:hypothetical protein